jgi:hypothetical protein
MAAESETRLPSALDAVIRQIQQGGDALDVDVEALIKPPVHRYSPKVARVLAAGGSGRRDDQ